MSELTRKSVTELAATIRERKVSPVELANAFLERIAEENPRLNAIVTLAPDLLEQARAAEHAVAAGKPLGPLHGVPLTIKDTIATAGLLTTSGSKRRAAFVPAEDAPVVARLRAAGAIILGKTNTAEMALAYDTENPVFGPANNPLDPERSPGGSSGGEAAAIAACFSPGGLGSDLMGSLRVPAHFCGIASLKPTTGAVSMAGHFPEAVGPYSLGAVVGPMARTVEDLELLFGVVAEASLPSLPPLKAGGVRGEGLPGVRVAVYANDENCPVTPETIGAVQFAAQALRDAGLEIVEELPPGIGPGPALWTALFAHGGVAQLRSLYAGFEDEAGPVARAITRRAETNAPTLDDFLDAWAERDRLRAELLAYMETAPLLVAPVGAIPAVPHGTRRVEVGGRSLSLFEAFGYCQTFNVFSLPVACIPAGHSPEGLPIGVQIVGRPFAEAQVLAAARVIEIASFIHE